MDIPVTVSQLAGPGAIVFSTVRSLRSDLSSSYAGFRFSLRTYSLMYAPGPGLVIASPSYSSKSLKRISFGMLALYGESFVRRSYLRKRSGLYLPGPGVRCLSASRAKRGLPPSLKFIVVLCIFFKDPFARLMKEFPGRSETENLLLSMLQRDSFKLEYFSSQICGTVYLCECSIEKKRFSLLPLDPYLLCYYYLPGFTS